MKMKLSCHSHHPNPAELPEASGDIPWDGESIGAYELRSMKIAPHIRHIARCGAIFISPSAKCAPQWHKLHLSLPKAFKSSQGTEKAASY